MVEKERIELSTQACKASVIPFNYIPILICILFTTQAAKLVILVYQGHDAQLYQNSGHTLLPSRA